MKVPLDNLQAMVRCMVCNKKHQPKAMVVLEEDEKRTALHLSCDGCGTASLVFLSLGQFGVMSVGVLTDLEHEEARTLYRAEEVSSDDVIDTHQFLKAYKGDISALY